LIIPIRIVLFGFLFAGLSACTSARLVETPDPELAIAQLKVGNTVEIINQDGSKVRFKLTAIDDETLYGTLDPPLGVEQVAVPRTDVRIVSLVKIDAGRTAAGGTVTAGVAFLVIALVTFISGTWIFG
jgi:hypothetical protein